MKISVGTVQFGCAYGSFNPRGQVPLNEVNELLSMAEDAGVEMLDTARAYGEAEKVLGKLDAPSRFKIVTKCPPLSKESEPAKALKEAFESSKLAMGAKYIYGYLLHNADDIVIPGVFTALKELRDTGQVKNIGLSGYDVNNIKSYCENYNLNIVQLPGNILDPWFKKIHLPDSVEIHVRSIFLQGFLLCNPNELPSHLKKFSNILNDFHHQAAIKGLTPIQAALSPLLNCNKVKNIVIGTDNPRQFSDIVEAEKKLRGQKLPELGEFYGITPDLTDPRKWNR